MAPIQRTPVQNSGGVGIPCNGVFSFDFNAWLQSGLDPSLSAGSTVFCQYWYRDPASPSTTGLTDALEFTFQP
jgi:hypothetical protein